MEQNLTSNTRERKKKQPYLCPRCGYTCDKKTHMKKHLYDLKKPCQGCLSAIDLTDIIKQHVLQNRVYLLPKQETGNNINQIINHYNTMNNFISNMESMTKLKQYIDHKQVDVLPFDRDIDNRYETKRQRFENNTFESDHREDVLDIIDKITQCKEDDLSDLNILLDKNMNKILLYTEGDWQELLATTGVQSIVKTIKDYFWDTYECFLIRNIEKGQRAVMMQELLEKHYRFLACVDVEPYIVDKPNHKIMYNGDDDEYWTDAEFNDCESHTIQDHFMPMYRKIEKDLNKKEKEDQKRQIIDIIKRNTCKNIMHLNKLIYSLLKKDLKFKDMLMPKEDE